MEYDRITDNAIKKVFESLIKSKILIKLRLSDTDYEQLTLLTGFRRKWNRTFILLGYPDGFKAAVGNKDAWDIDFEFTGPDRIPYSFSTIGGEIYRNQLCLPFPELVYRNQRRKFFRLEAPEGTTVEFACRQSECRAHVVDISVGGALIAKVCRVDGDQNDLPFQVGDVLEDVTLMFPSESGETRVKIKKAIVVRFDRRGPHTAACCGLEFIEIKQSQVDTLTEFIYTLQRYRLRHRLRPDR
ncbi:MAG: flagellar brake protein [Desulfobacterales bacterium]